MSDSPLLLNHLQQLSRMGLLKAISREAEAEYSFTSTLVYESTRGSLVKQDRRKLHLAIAETIEDIYLERLEEFAPLLADHFHHAGEDRQAMLYYTMAGNLALQRFANAEAARFFSSSLAVARSEFRKGSEAEQAGLWKALGELYQKRGQALWWSGSYTQAVENYREMETLAAGQGDRQMQLICLADLAQLYSTPNPKFDAERGEQLALQAQEIARDLNDFTMEARILWILMANGFFSNRLKKAEVYGKQSLVLARQYKLADQLALTLADLTKYVYTPQMQFDLALAAIDEAKSIWREYLNTPRLADTLLTEAIIYVNLGDFPLATSLVQEGIQIAQSIGSLWHLAYGWMIQGQIHLEQGEYDQASTVLDESYRTSELSGFLPGLTIVNGLQSVLLMRLGALYQAIPYSHYAVKTAESQAPFWLTQALGSQALLYLELGDFKLASEAIDRSHIYNSDHVLGFYNNYIPMAESELSLIHEDYFEAIQAVDEIITLLQVQQARGILPYFLYYKGLALKGSGRLEEAREVLNQARETAASISVRWPWWRSLASLAEISELTGQADEANRYWQSAREILGFIHDHAGTPEMQRQFMDMPAVQQILAKTSPIGSGV